MNTRPPACRECGGQLKRMDGREAGQQALKDNWICREAIAERAGGGKGPFKHNGLVWTVAYVLRSAENRTAIELEKMEAEKMAREVEVTNVSRREAGLEPLVLRVPDWQSARPGDLLVDRGFKTVYYIDSDGSRRKLPNREACQEAIEKVREVVQQIQEQMAAQRTVPNPLLAGLKVLETAQMEVGTHA